MGDMFLTITDDKGLPKGSKSCALCLKTLKYYQFYRNRDWEDQDGYDAWCTSCVKKKCVTKEGFQDYFYYNNRTWLEDKYEQAEIKARYETSMDKKYNQLKSDNARASRRQQILQNIIFKQMNTAGFYKYVSNIKKGKTVRIPKGEQEDDINEDTQIDEKGEVKVYSDKWQTLLDKKTEERLEQELKAFYSNNKSYSGDETLAVQIAKSKIALDNAYTLMLNGDMESKDYEAHHKMWLDLYKAANATPDKKKEAQSSDWYALGKIIEYMEENNMIKIGMHQFEEDETDKVLNDYRHIITAVSGEGAFGG